MQQETVWAQTIATNLDTHSIPSTLAPRVCIPSARGGTPLTGVQLRQVCITAASLQHHTING